MNICVFGAASPRIDQIFIDEVEELGENLAKRGHNLVFGAGGHGLMGAAARGFHKGGGQVTGVVPKFFRDEDVEELYEACDEFIYTDTMAERKAKMEELADAFVVVPGGIGTFEEFFEVLTLKQLDRHRKPIILFNVRNYYTGIETLMHIAVTENFLKENCLSLYRVFEQTQDEDVITYLEGGDDLHDDNISDFKLG